MGSASQAMITMSSPEAIAPSAIVQMAKSPNPFAAMHNAEPPPFPGPMFSGLNAIVNPFSSSRPSSAAANTRGAPATTDAADTHAATTTAAAPASATATAGAKPLPAATTAAPSSSAPATAMLGMPTAAAPAAGVAVTGTAPLPAVTSATLSQTQTADSAAVPVQTPAADSAAVPVQTRAADSAAVPVQTPAADSAAVPVRNPSKRKWDAMTRIEAAVAPVPSSSAVALINSTAAPTDAGTASTATPAALPTATAQAGRAGAERALAAAQNNALSQNACSQSVSVSQANQPQPASQALEAASKQTEAASKALAGKEMAAKLAAGFAEQHRSGVSTAARALPTNIISSGVPASITLSEAVQIAAAAAAEKLIRDQASKARLSVQSSGDTHAARMEAIRLRNLARHDVPEPAALPPPPPQPDTTAVAAVDRPHPAAQASAATDQPQNSPRNSSKGKSKARRKRHRELPQVPWETEQMPGLTGNAVESGVSGAGGRRRTDSPASGDTWDTVRQQAHSPGTRLVSLMIICAVAMLGMSVAMLSISVATLGVSVAMLSMSFAMLGVSVAMLDVHEQICITAQDNRRGPASL